ncbi:hypothetical protein LCGC14_0755110 [marine sediment metagenome]|uniref:Uncharacterized protein n=1 Tax=marine sediment metagenome TaxID=412755 RepID=A0A0F9QMR3_9ZZZZ
MPFQQRRPQLTDKQRQRYLDRAPGTWWVEEDGSPPTYDETVGHLLRVKALRLYALDEQVRQSDGYEAGDEESPFYSERYLYPLMGKEDARTILATLKTTIRMLEALQGKPFPIDLLF